MAERTEAHITIAAPPARVMAVITDFESYPEWVGSVREVEVVSTLPDGRAHEVRFVLDAGAIKDEYTLEYDYVSATNLRWHLVRGKILRALDGGYRLTPANQTSSSEQAAPAAAQGPPNGAGRDYTEVSYQLRVDVSIPMIGMLKRKAEKVIIDTALKELKRRVEG